MIHKLKTWPEYFQNVYDRKKMFEIRKNDRDFKVGDGLILEEWDNEKQEYTGRVCFREIYYILEGGKFGIEEGFVVMSIA